MFKATEKYDAKYGKHGLNGLLSTAPIKVTKKNKLLLLLSLVDIIECTKRFSSKKINGDKKRCFYGKQQL